MHVRNVQFDHAGTRPDYGVVQRNAGVGVGRGIQDNTGSVTSRLSSTGLLDPVDELTFAVGLTELQSPTQLVRHLQAGTLDIGQGRLAVDIGLTRPKQVEVRAVQDVGGGHGGTQSELRASEIAHRRTEEKRAEAFSPLRATTTAADPRRDARATQVNGCAELTRGYRQRSPVEVDPRLSPRPPSGPETRRRRALGAKTRAERGRSRGYRAPPARCRHSPEA